MLVEIRLGKIHQRRGIDVDVVEPRVELFLDQCAKRLELAVGVGAVFLGVHLYVIALNEQRPLESFAQRRRYHDRDVLRGPLIGIGDFAAGDLADHGADIEAFRRAKDRSARVVGQNADVDRRCGERSDFPTPACQVELVDRRGADAGPLADFPQHPPRLHFGVFVAEHRVTHQRIHLEALAAGGIVELLQHA